MSMRIAKQTLVPALVAMGVLAVAMIGLLMNRQTPQPSTLSLDEPYRPQYHFTPPQMWMNDPNGMVYDQGEYHLFYQYNPADVIWGPMHWGHAVSRDLVNWEHLPIALAPDATGMIFSGSAVVDTRNTAGFGAGALIALYTSATDEHQAQSLAYSTDRGRTWTAYSGNPLILPPKNIRNFRDPKVFWYGDEASGHWVMVVAAGSAILCYTSPDLLTWEAASGFGFGYGSSQGVWETPDLFELPVDGGPDTRWVLSVGVGDGGPAGGTGTQYFVGRFDGHTFISDNPKDTILWADAGADFYAAQSWNDVPNGRRIWLAWMNNWRYAATIPTSTWRGAFTLPRELSLTATPDGIRLVQQPVKELDVLRGARTTWPAQTVVSTATLDLPSETVEINLTLQIPEDSDADRVGIRLHHGSSVTTIGIAIKSHTLFATRGQCPAASFDPAFDGTQLAPLTHADGPIQLRVWVDRASVEVFAEGGRVVLTDQIFPCSGPVSLELFADGGPVQVTALTLDEIHPAAFIVQPPTQP